MALIGIDRGTRPRPKWATPARLKVGRGKAGADRGHTIGKFTIFAYKIYFFKVFFSQNVSINKFSYTYYHIMFKKVAKKYPLDFFFTSKNGKGGPLQK